jgi:HAT1-interacting factor 1
VFRFPVFSLLWIPSSTLPALCQNIAGSNVELTYFLLFPDMQLVDLRKPPMDVDSVLAANNPMSGILGAALGESSTETQARIADAKKNATDLSGLVRRKAKDEAQPDAAVAAEQGEGEAAKVETNGSKRKAEEPASGENAESKKAKVDETEAPAAVTES